MTEVAPVIRQSCWHCSGTGMKRRYKGLPDILCAQCNGVGIQFEKGEQRPELDLRYRHQHTGIVVEAINVQHLRELVHHQGVDAMPQWIREAIVDEEIIFTLEGVYVDNGDGKPPFTVGADQWLVFGEDNRLSGLATDDLYSRYEKCRR